jgi:PTS system ascorbate-specific IIB component
VKIVTICGHGLGTALLLKMTVEASLKDLGAKDVQVEVSDYGSARGIKADLYVVTGDMVKHFESTPDLKDRYVAVRQVMDKNEIKSKLQEFFQRTQGAR